MEEERSEGEYAPGGIMPLGGGEGEVSGPGVRMGAQPACHSDNAVNLITVLHCRCRQARARKDG